MEADQESWPCGIWDSDRSLNRLQRARAREQCCRLSVFGPVSRLNCGFFSVNRIGKPEALVFEPVNPNRKFRLNRQHCPSPPWFGPNFKILIVSKWISIFYFRTLCKNLIIFEKLGILCLGKLILWC